MSSDCTVAEPIPTRLESNMPKELEAKLKREYGANSKIPYKIMNKLGLMNDAKHPSGGRIHKDYTATSQGNKITLRRSPKAKALAHKTDAKEGNKEVHARLKLAQKKHGTGYHFGYDDKHKPPAKY